MPALPAIDARISPFASPNSDPTVRSGSAASI
jgi:hypothetical protein